ncbi:hypothetical protein TNCV_4361521 [Trichonephila clavipes]|nr:hypothetical protein TNCV_4361521 [Trichonephila clavipes]
MKESQAARYFLVSELRTIHPFIDSDCPDHSSIESKNSETIKDNVKINELDKKRHQKRKIPRIIQTTLSFRVKRLDPPRQLQLFLDSHEEQRILVHFMDEDKTMEFYVILPKENKFIKVVIKGLPRTKSQDIVTDLEELGYSVTSCNQLISKRTELDLPFS